MIFPSRSVSSPRLPSSSHSASGSSSRLSRSMPNPSVSRRSLPRPSSPPSRLCASSPRPSRGPGPTDSASATCWPRAWRSSRSRASSRDWPRPTCSCSSCAASVASDPRCSPSRPWRCSCGSSMRTSAVAPPRPGRADSSSAAWRARPSAASCLRCRSARPSSSTPARSPSPPSSPWSSSPPLASPSAKRLWWRRSRPGMWHRMSDRAAGPSCARHSATAPTVLPSRSTSRLGSPPSASAQRSSRSSSSRDSSRAPACRDGPSSSPPPYKPSSSCRPAASPTYAAGDRR